MSHPFNSIRQGKVERSRVPHITRGYAAGGAVHADAGDDKIQIKRMVKKTALKLAGGSVTRRADRPSRARGGAVKPTTVNVIIQPSEPKLAAPSMPPLPMMPKPPMAPPSGGGGMAPPGGQLPLPPPGVLPRAKGGRATASKARGGVVQPNFPNDTKSTTVDKPPLPIPQEDKDKLKELSRAFGGRATAATAGIGRGRTPVQHTNNKQDGLNVGRGSAVSK